MQYDSATQVEGKGTGCQDRVALISLTNGVVVVLADGAGGTSGGAEAASLVLQRVREAVTEGRALNERGLRQLLLELSVELEGVGQTTAVIVVIRRSELVGASVGDSVAWLVDAKECRELTDGQPRKPLLGGGLAEPLTFRCAAGDGTLMVASDGVHNYARRDAVIELLRRTGMSVDACSAAIIDAARMQNGALQDDAAVALVRLGPRAEFAAALRAWIAAKGDEQLQRCAEMQLERWINQVSELKQSDGLSASLDSVGDDGTVSLSGTIWSLESQLAHPFSVRLRLRGEWIDEEEVSVKSARPR